jgi:UDP-N-acetylglucosamine/UDP-N-acetylgalactosamine diphosphorylase
MPRVTDINEQLIACGQSHLVDYLSKVTPQTAFDSIRNQIEQIDLFSLSRMVDRYVINYTPAPPPASIEPAKYYSLDGDWDRESYRAKGEELIRQSKVACFTVAGGQGSRLGYEGPKGCFPTSCVIEKPLFQIFAEGILGSQNKYESVIPWYIMTSPLNHEATQQFFEQHQYFGLDPHNVRFFQQGVMPSLDAQSGQILMADPISLATNPDGHGGAFKALAVSGALADMQARGIEHMSYFQVDNPHACLVDPLFLGLHAFAPDSSGEFSSKMVAKSSWDEKVGVFCDVDGATEIIRTGKGDDSRRVISIYRGFYCDTCDQYKVYRSDCFESRVRITVSQGAQKGSAFRSIDRSNCHTRRKQRCETREVCLRWDSAGIEFDCG